MSTSRLSRFVTARRCAAALPKQHRRGAIVVLALVLMVFMLGVLAMSIDLGYKMTIQEDLRRATDAAALAGAGAMIDGTDRAGAAAFEYLARNPIGNQTLYQQREDWQAYAAQWQTDHPDEFSLQFGHWDPTRSPGTDPNKDNRFFTDTTKAPSAIWVKASRVNVPFFFAKALGQDDFNVTAQTIARYQPRDIALVLDFSGSMNYDSQLRRITDFGASARTAVETSLQEIYADLGSPAYGSLAFTPQYLTVVGAAPKSPAYRQITVTFRSSDVTVSSTKTLTSVKLTFSDNSTQTFSGLSGTSGTFKGTSGNSSKRINSVTVKSGTSDTGETLSDDYTAIKKGFGLTSVAYPYPSGSWDTYIDYVKTSSYINTAGYRKMYGFMTLINYWLESKPRYSETPDLWKVRAQPIATVKDASGVFFDFIKEVETDDRVAFVIYNSPSQTAQVENVLTTDFAAVQDTIQHRQAAHYDNYTNIGAGIQYGIKELDDHGRVGAFKMIVLMTDGNANKPTNETTARNFALQQAQAAASKRYPIFAISLGCDADADLLQQVADATNGYHFIIPGGQTVTDYKTALEAAFQRIANARPLQIVK